MQDNMAVVLAAIRQKFLDSSCPHRIWLVGGGGGLNGAYLAGVQAAFVERDLFRVFTGTIGVSTSVPALGYAHAAMPGNTERHFYEATLYSEEACSRKFCKWNGRLDVPWLVSAFRGATGKLLDWERVRNSGVRFVGVATDWETGLPQYIEPHNEEAFFELIAAACSVPGLAMPASYQGRLMIDSGASDPCPVPWLMSLPETERPTHILIITNTWHVLPDVQRQLREWKLLRLVFGRKVPPRILDGFALRHRRFHRQVAAALARSDVTVATQWLPWQRKPFARNPEEIEALTRAGYERFRVLLDEGGR